MVKKALQDSMATATDLGAALRVRRKELGLTMQYVADSAGLSVGFISQVERGLTAPSLASLVTISAVLETHISTFLSQPSAPAATTRGAERSSYSVAGALNSYERLSSNFENSQLHSVLMREPPGYRSEPVSHAGEEMFFMISGEITVEIEGKTDILRQGDSIHFDSRRVHSCWNHGTEDASVLWCGTMDIFGDAPAPLHKDVTHKSDALKSNKGDET